MAKGQCGFLTVVYFYSIQNIDQLQQFEQQYSVNAISPKTWRNTKKKRRLELAKSVYYINDGANGERDAYLQHFSLEQYKKLKRKEREQHTLKSCAECQKYKHRNIFKLRRGNVTEPMKILHEAISRSPFTPQQCQEFAGEVAEAANRVLRDAQAPRSFEYYLKRKAKHSDDVTKMAKQKMSKGESGEAEKQLAETKVVASAEIEVVRLERMTE